MVVTHSRRFMYYGESTDPKPTLALSYPDALFFECNTGALYQMREGSWIQRTAGGSGGSSGYTITKSGSSYVSVGKVDADFYTVLTYAISQLPTGGKIELGPGDFSLTVVPQITQNNITIEGAGVDVTRILYDTPTSAGGGFQVGTTSMGTAHTLTGNALLGQRVITGSSTGITAGDWIFITALVPVTSSSATRYDAEMHRVQSVDSSTQITVEDNLMANFNTADTAAYYKVPFVNNFTLKNLTMYDNRATIAVANNGPSFFSFCYNLHIENVKFENMPNSSLHVEGCFFTVCHDVYFEKPRYTVDDTDHNYGLYLTGCVENFSWIGGWGNYCRHTVTTNTNSGGINNRGRQRNLTFNGITSFNANTAHFDLHQGALGVSFNGCHTLGGQHHVSASTDVQGFNLRSPATVNGCIVQGVTHESIVIWIDDDAVGTDLIPGGNRTVINGCSIISTLKDDADTVRRGIVLNTNRASVTISNNNFFDINQESIRILDGCKDIIIEGNQFNSCGANLVNTNGLISCIANVDELIVKDNIFDAGTPSPNGRPLVVTTSVDGLVFADNDVTGLTNKSPTIPAISTKVNVHDNLGLNPMNQIANPLNTSNNTCGFYGGTTSTAVASTDYLIVGSAILLTSAGGTGVSITIKDGAGNTIASGLATLAAQYLPLGYKINFGGFSGSPTLTVFAV